jgi:hypothetical protein
MKTRGRWDDPGPRLSDLLLKALLGAADPDPALREDPFTMPRRGISSANAVEVASHSAGETVNGK